MTNMFDTTNMHLHNNISFSNHLNKRGFFFLDESENKQLMVK